MRRLRPVLLMMTALVLAGCGLSLPGVSASTPSPTPSAALPSVDQPTPDEPSPTPESRPQGTVRFEVTGGGTAYSIDFDPGDAGVADRQTNVALPWTKEVPNPGDVEIFQVVVVGGTDPACRILIDGEEVASEPAGGSAHCTYEP